jgi:hypothetical protein
MLPMIAGQAIMALRYDYAIGGGDWFTVNTSGDVEAQNPLRYAQSLKDQGYSWVSARPTSMMVIVESDWKAEMASREVDDPSIENSGNNLKDIEVDYRKNSGGNTTEVYFYRTKEEALAPIQTAKKWADDASKVAAEWKASKAEWKQKLLALRYMVANRDDGFKLVYAVCKDAGKNAAGESTCNNEGSHDWSDNRSVPYHWFSDMQGCQKALVNINAEYPADAKVERGDAFMSDCVPASKMSGRTLKGYVAVVTLAASAVSDDDAVYANMRDGAAKSATVFGTFKACTDSLDPAYSRIMKDLGIGENGQLLSHKTRSIDLTVTCVRVYRP